MTFKLDFAHAPLSPNALNKRPMSFCDSEARQALSAITDLIIVETGDPAAQVFNASIPGGDLLVSEVVLKQLLRDGMRPR